MVQPIINETRLFSEAKFEKTKFITNELRDNFVTCYISFFQFDWMKYLSNVFRDTEYTVQATDPIRIQPLSYYLSVIPELNSASKR